MRLIMIAFVFITSCAGRAEQPPAACEDKQIAVCPTKLPVGITCSDGGAPSGCVAQSIAGAYCCPKEN